MKLVLAALAASAFIIHNNRFIKIKTSSRSRRLRVIIEQCARGRLNDGIVEVMIYNLTGRMPIDRYAVKEDIVHKAGLELARHGTPDSCILSMYISNFTGVQYPESTSEIIREAACHFKSTDDPRTVNIVQGKYLFEDSTCGPVL